jgi:hypothetical protein
MEEGGGAGCGVEVEVAVGEKETPPFRILSNKGRGDGSTSVSCLTPE